MAYLQGVQMLLEEPRKQENGYPTCQVLILHIRCYTTDIFSIPIDI